MPVLGDTFYGILIKNILNVLEKRTFNVVLDLIALMHFRLLCSELTSGLRCRPGSLPPTSLSDADGGW